MSASLSVRELSVGFENSRNFLPYYTNSPWRKNDESFIFFSEKNGEDSPILAAFYPASGKTETLANLDKWKNHPSTEREEEFLSTCISQNEDSVFIPYSNSIIKLNLKDGSVKELFKIEPGFRIGGPLCISSDGKLLAAAQFPPIGIKPPENTRVFVISAEDGKLLADTTVPLFATHFQFMDNDKTLLFAHEGATEGIPDRLNALDWKTGTHKNLYRHIHSPTGELLEYIGHERAAGKFVVAVRYPVSKIESGIILLDPESGLCSLIDQDDYWHAASDGKGENFVMDTMWWGSSKRKTEHEMDIVHLHRKTGKKTILKHIHSDPKRQIYHPHPQLNADGTKLLFIDRTSVPKNEEGSFIVYMELQAE